MVQHGLCVQGAALSLGVKLVSLGIAGHHPGWGWNHQHGEAWKCGIFELEVLSLL